MRLVFFFFCDSDSGTVVVKRANACFFFYVTQVRDIVREVETATQFFAQASHKPSERGFTDWRRR